MMKKFQTGFWTMALAVSLCGCFAPRVVVIPSDKEVHWLAPGQTVTASNGWWLVPDARMQEIVRTANTPK